MRPSATRPAVDAVDDGVVPLDHDVGAHAGELAGEHEAVLEDVLRDDATALGQGEKAHGLGLHVSGEAGERQGLHIGGAQRRGRIAPDGAAALTALDDGAHLLELLEDEAEVLGVEAGDLDGVAGQRADREEGARLDAVADDGVLDGVQLGDALDLDDGRAGAGDLGAHLVEEVGEVDDLGLARGVVDGGGALGEHRGHHEVLGGADAGERQRHGVAHEAVGRARVDVAVVDLELHAEGLEA